MKVFILLSVVLLLIGCQTSKEQEVLSLEEVTGTSINDNESVSDSVPVNQIPVTTISSDSLVHYAIELDEATLVDSLLFPDRYTPLLTEKFSYSQNETSVFVARWNFKDSAACMNVLMNWLECFSSRCLSVRFGDSKPMQKNGFLILAGNKEFWFIESNNAQERAKWESLFNGIETSVVKHVISQGKHGKTNWYSLDAALNKTILTTN